MQDSAEELARRSSGRRGFASGGAGVPQPGARREEVWAGCRVPLRRATVAGGKAAGPGLPRVLLEKVLPVGCGMLWKILVSVIFRPGANQLR